MFVAPVIAVIAMSATQLSLNLQQQTIIEHGFETMQLYIELEHFLHKLELEGTSMAAYITSHGYNLEALGLLEANHDDVSKQYQLIKPHFTFTPETEELLSNWTLDRECIYSECPKGTGESTVRFYSCLIDGLISAGDQQISIPQESREDAMWSKFVSVTVMVRVSNVIAKEQSLVAISLTQCHITDLCRYWFMELEGRQTSLMKMAINYYPKMKDSYTTHTINASFIAHAQKIKEDIMTRSYIDQCLKMSLHERFLFLRESLMYYALHLNVLTQIQDDVIDEINVDLKYKREGSKRVVYAYIGVMVGVAGICIVISGWYSNNIHTLLRQMQNSASNISKKTKELSREKRVTIFLVYKSILVVVLLNQSFLAEIICHKDHLYRANACEECTANYNCKYVFISQKTNKKAQNVLSLLQVSVL